IEPGSLLGRLLGPEAQVNSFHRQAVDRLPDGGRVVARSPDGLVEAMEVPGEAGEETSAEAGEETGAGSVDRVRVGCQFHPEWLYEAHPGFERLFEEFVAAAGEFRRQADSG